LQQEFEAEPILEQETEERIERRRNEGEVAVAFNFESKWEAEGNIEPEEGQSILEAGLEVLLKICSCREKRKS
jgi:hypothetical protein